MGAPDKDTRTRDQKDRYELGDVNSVADLDPADTQKGMVSREKEQKKRLESPESVGYFEVSANNMAGVANLHVDPTLAKYGNAHGGGLGEFQAEFNTFAQPMRSTVRAMGRVKDLSVGGAALTPAELKKSAAGKQFKQLSLHGKQDAGAQNAFNDWSNAQTNMKTKIDGFASGQILLQGAMHAYAGARKILESKRKEAERSSKQAELNEINETAETLARITEFTVEAWNAYGEISEAMEATSAINEFAEGDEAAMIEGDDHAGEALSKKHKATNKLLDVGSAGADAGKATKQIYANVNKYIAQGKLNIDLKDVFVILTGNAQKYTDLMNDIAALDGQIQALGIQAQMDGVNAATVSLKGWKADLNVRRDEVRNARQASRKGAQNFAQNMGADENGTMAMYAAEASFELAEFGELAAKEQKTAEPYARRTNAWINEHTPYFRTEPLMVSDVADVMQHANAVISSGKFFDQHLPQWKKTAAEWNAFFKSETKKSLVAGPNAADKASDAP